ncbi:hypothetical protein [Roseomonas sp. AR75]|uniref:hypothetical protein n=1 Tax=Roseomonas sp. AR75 TaxID=2562311 RepID=UPI0010C1562B|nr:hypothetical protein [Roseomonas sp. AR75]
MMRRRLAALTVPLLLSACAEVWTRPGTPEPVAEATQASCRQRSELAVPPQMVWVVVRPAGYVPEQRCWRRDGRDYCRTYRRWRPAEYGMADANDAPRESWRQQCMAAAGFTFQGYRPLRLN